jgi:hypothetical protein
VLASQEQVPAVDTLASPRAHLGVGQRDWRHEQRARHREHEHEAEEAELHRQHTERNHVPRGLEIVERELRFVGVAPENGLSQVAKEHGEDDAPAHRLDPEGEGRVELQHARLLQVVPKHPCQVGEESSHNDPLQPLCPDRSPSEQQSSDTQQV